CDGTQNQLISYDTVTVNLTQMQAGATSAATSCNGSADGTITVTPTTGTGPFTYTMDGGTPVTGPAPYTFTNVPPGAHTIFVTDAFGCVTPLIPVTVVAGPPISTTASKTDALCNGSATGTITVVQPTVGAAPFEYSLDGTTWQTSNVFTGLAAGAYTVYFREGGGCQGTLPIIVAEPTVLATSVSASAAICNAQSNGTILVAANGGVSPYQYSLNGTTWQGSNMFNVPAGNYTITIRDANGCISTQNTTITEPAVLAANAVATNASCDGGNDGTIVVTANGGNSSYSYSIDGINFQSSNQFNVAPGNYTVTVKDNLGCSTTFNTTVGLTDNLTLAQQADPVICESKSVQLQLNSNATQYAWTPATGLDNASIYNPVANPTVTTQYIVTATLGRCSANDTVTVNVNAAPVPNAGVDGYICYGQTYQLSASGGTQYSWSPSTYLDDANSANPVSTPTKDITYTLSILSDANGCASLVTDNMRIDVTPPIKVKTYPYDTIGYPGDQFQILVVPSDSDVINYTWNPTIGLSNPNSTIGTGNLNIPNPIVTIGAIGEDIQYQVITSTIAGCRGEGYVKVRVYKGPDIYVPTGFSPNNDGKNDKFTPFPVGMKSYNYFRVFNRWGQMVFSTTKLNDGWDGRLGGQEQPSGVYVWMIEGLTKDNRVITKKGTVMLIR
ncbi:MAG TPA: gliding motility-associated C-terminal domain-containing protein, partial [Chitinophagaceae bacterium]|nr:gliding motility-associated C-terminal domain-containing protein [Chitinophagaceae bacterium]